MTPKQVMQAYNILIKQDQELAAALIVHFDAYLYPTEQRQGGAVIKDADPGDEDDGYGAGV